MSSFFTCTKLPIFLCLILLASCGGGGGGGGGDQSPSQPVEQLSSFGQASDKTFAQLNQISAELSEIAYTGVSAEASVSAQSVQAVFSVLEYLDGGGQAVGSLFNKPSGQEVLPVEQSRNLFDLMSSRVTKVVPATLASQKVAIDESEVCDNGQGSLRLFGELEDTDVGALNFTATNCLTEGEVFSGRGAVFVHDIDIFELTIYFDDVEITSGSDTQYLSGDVFQNSANEFVYNVTVLNSAREATFKLENFRDFSADFTPFHSFSGVMKLGEFGAVTVAVGQYREEDSGELRFSSFLLDFSEDKVSVSDVDGFDISFYQLELVGGIDGEPVFAVLLGDELTNGSDVELTFTPLDDINFPPTTFSVFIANSDTPDTTNDLLTRVNLVDSDSMEVRYRWFINGELVAGIEGGRLPAGMAVGGDFVSVEAIAEDERYSIVSQASEVVLRDAEPTITFTEAPVFSAGIQSSISVLHDDPDTKSIVEQDGLTLVSGPGGLSYNGSDIDWIPPNQFSFQLEYPVVFMKPNGDKETHYITVKDTGAAASINAFSMNSNAFSPQVIGQFDSDPALEVLNLLGNSISISEIGGNTLKQEFFFPFPVFKDSHVTGITSGDINSDGVQEVFAADENNIVQVNLQEGTTRTIFTRLSDPSDSNDISGIAFLNSPPRLAVLTSLELIIVDAISGEPLVTSLFVPVVNGTSVGAFVNSQSMHVGNVDDDENLEVVLGLGLVIDTNSGVIDRIPADIVEVFEVADIDNDGREEVVASALVENGGSSGRTSIQIFNVESQGSSDSLSELLGDSFFLGGATVFRVVNDNGRVVLMVGNIFTSDGAEGVVAFEVVDQSAVQIWSFPQPDPFADDLNILIDPAKENVHVIYGGSSADSQYSIVSKDTGALILTETRGCGDLSLHRVNELSEELIFTCERSGIEDGLFLVTKGEEEPVVDKIFDFRVFDTPVVAQIDDDESLELLTSIPGDSATIALDLADLGIVEPYAIEVAGHAYTLNTSVDQGESDLILASASFIDDFVLDAKAQEILMTIPGARQGGNDFEAVHDIGLGIVAAEAHFSGLKLWSTQDGTIEARLIAEVERDCLSVEFHTINDDQRLLCTINVGFGIAEQSEVLMFDLSLNEIGSIAVENKALGVTSLPAKVDGADIVVAVQLPNPTVFGGAETFRLQGYEASTGSILWSTPALNGVVLGNGNDEDDFKVVSGLSPSGEVIIGVGSGPIMYDIR